MLLDAIVLYFSIVLPYSIKYQKFLTDFEFIILMFYIFTCIVFFVIFDLYNPWSHFSKLPIHYKSFIAIPIMIVFYLLFSFFLNPYENIIFESRVVFFISIIFFTTFFTLSRYFFYIRLQPENLNIRLLVICDQNVKENFQKEIEYRGGKWKVFYLLYDSYDSKENDQSYILQEKEFDRILEEKWTAVIIAKKDLDSKKIQKLLEYKQKGNLVYDLIHFYEYYFFKIPLYYIDDYWFFSTKGFVILENQSIVRMKRIFELLIVFILILFLLPFLPFLLILVFFSDGFPLIYKQERLGRYNKIFTAYKFRTMIKDAEKIYPYTREKDPRVTPIGNFLRKTRLDELPQLLNVIKGELSLIGPRSEWIKLVEIYKEKVPFYYYRHLVTPGITGWAQVMYPYGSSIEDTIQKLEYDLYYIKNYSLLLDFSILIKTIRSILFVRGR